MYAQDSQKQQGWIESTDSSLAGAVAYSRNSILYRGGDQQSEVFAKVPLIFGYTSPGIGVRQECAIVPSSLPIIEDLDTWGREDLDVKYR